LTPIGDFGSFISAEQYTILNDIITGILYVFSYSNQ